MKHLRLGVSACLLGESVRFNGNHCREDFVADTLARFFSLVPVCPEMEAGLGVPRESLRLVASARGPLLLAPRSGRDFTSTLSGWAADRLPALEALDLCGFVLKKDSPSCGLERVRVYGAEGQATRTGRGVFARALIRRLPLLPAEEEGRLHDPVLRDSFLQRVLAYRRLSDFFRTRWTLGGLVKMHTREKLLLLAYSPEGYRRLGRLVAGARGRGRRDIEKRYCVAFMRTLATPPSRGRVVNALQHAAGYFKRELPAEQREELSELITLHGKGSVPLLAPLALLRRRARAAAPYLVEQTWLSPQAADLLPRERV